jgi:O-antigen ligase
MILSSFRKSEESNLESLGVLIIFSLTWLGFGKYMAGLLLILFVFVLFFKRRRGFLLAPLRDRTLLVLLMLFTLNNIISSLLSIKLVESAVLSLIFFLIIYIPISFVRFSLHSKNNSFISRILPVSLVIALIIVSYLLFVFFKTIISEGLVIKRYSFYFLGKASTPDTLVMLGGLGYGLIRQNREKKYLWLGFLYLLFCFSGVVLTYDRGGILSFFLLIIILLSFDYKRLTVFCLLVVAIIAATFFFEPLRRYQHIFDYLYLKSSQNRLLSHAQLATFKGAWEMIKDHWLLGVGTGNYASFSKQYGTGSWYAYAHNFILQFWAENGLFGMLFGLSIIGLILYRWAKSWRLYKYKYIALGVGVSFIGMLIGNLTNSTIWMIKIALPFWLLAGVMNAIYHLVQEENAPTEEG